MVNGETTPPLQPVVAAERITALDTIRGIALLGVLLVNLFSDFRQPLAAHIQNGFPDSAPVDHLVDLLVAGLLEFKAFTIFTLLFGVGTAIFSERASARGNNAMGLLARRYLVLLGFGLCHLLLVWNGDILTLYAVCAFLLLPFLRLPTLPLAIPGIATSAGSFAINWEFLWPSEEIFRHLVTVAKLAYPQGNPVDLFHYHLEETRLLIVPLLVLSIPRTVGVMALGVVAGRTGIFHAPQNHQRLLQAVTVVGTLVGAPATTLALYATTTSKKLPIPGPLLDGCSYVPLALAITAWLLLAMGRNTPRLFAPIAALGQMALSNYLAQSVVLSVLFFGYGFGLATRVGSAVALVIGLTLYAIQATFSLWWLRRFRFGPAEWLWRSLTYGRRQQLQKIPVP